MLRPQPTSTLFPYTTLFRSHLGERHRRGDHLRVATRLLSRDPPPPAVDVADDVSHELDRKSTRLNSSHVEISYAVFCLKKQKSTSRSQRRTKNLSSARPRRY